MITINIICVGKIKEQYIKMGINDFSKRISFYARLNIIQLKEENSVYNNSLSIKKESAFIIETLHKCKGYSILLDISGVKRSSEDMSKKIEKILLGGNSVINFIIGGSDGVDEQLKKIVSHRMSFSDLTFPHQLIRLILLEQIYRWLSIIGNSKYHK